MIVDLDHNDQGLATETAIARASTAGTSGRAHFGGAGAGLRGRWITDLIGCLGELAVVRAFRLPLDRFAAPEWAPSDITAGLEVRTARLARHRKLFTYEKDEGRTELYVFARLHRRTLLAYPVELAGWITRSDSKRVARPWGPGVTAVDVDDLRPIQTCPLWSET